MRTKMKVKTKIGIAIAAVIVVLVVALGAVINYLVDYAIGRSGDGGDREVSLEVEQTPEGVEAVIAANRATFEKQTEDFLAANPGEAVLTSTGAGNVNFAAEAKLSREQVRSKNKESLMEIINNKELEEASKQAAIEQMVKMTDISEKEEAAEMLLEAKGFTNVVVSITDNSADVVLDMGADASDEKRAQVEDIVKRKTGVSAENIIITPIESSSQDTAAEN